MEATKKTKSLNIQDVKVSNEPSISTGIAKLDKWFSAENGIVLGSTILLSGTSGAGKTSLMINLMKNIKNQVSSLYSREMRSSSIKKQTKNVKIEHNNAFIADKSTCSTFGEYMLELERLKPKIVIIDSLQAIAQEDFTDMSEEAACNLILSELRTWVEKNNAILILICHNTKDGDFAGRNTILQYVDCHAIMEFEKKQNIRKIFWSKNRKGSIGELFYEFGVEGMEFFTEEEYEIKRTVKTNDIKELMLKSIEMYLSKIDKKHKNFKTFKNEYTKMSAMVRNDFEDDYLFLGEIIRLIDTLCAKHSL